MKRKHTTTWELYAKTIRMRAAERRVLRERLVAFMEYHPVRVPLQETVSNIDAPRVLTSEPYFVFRFSSWQFRSFASAFVMFMMVGIPLYAEKAIPGDVLYAMKIRVNEEVKASLTWTPAGKIAWESQRVERRVAEARLLAKEGKLTGEAEASLAATVRQHTNSASREIATLRTTDAEGAAVAQVGLESTLEVQTAVLTNGAGTSTASTSIGNFVNVVQEAKDGVSAHDPYSEAPLSYDRMVVLLESEMTRAHKLYATLKT